MTNEKIITTVQNTGWNITFMLHNISQQSQYKYAVSFYLPENINIIGNIWGDNIWACEVQILKTDKNKHTVYFDFTNSKTQYGDYSLKPNEKYIFSFSHDSSEFLNSNDITEIETFDDSMLQSDLSLKIISPAKPNDYNKTEKFEFLLTRPNNITEKMFMDWDSQIILSNLLIEGKYSVTLFDIKSTDKIYVPIDTNPYVIIDNKDHKNGIIKCEYDYDNKYSFQEVLFTISENNLINNINPELKINIISQNVVPYYNNVDFNIVYGQIIKETLLVDNKYNIYSNKKFINNNIFYIKNIDNLSIQNDYQQQIYLELQKDIIDTNNYANLTIKINNYNEGDTVLINLIEINNDSNEIAQYEIIEVGNNIIRQNFIKPGTYKIEAQSYEKNNITCKPVLINHNSESVHFDHLSDMLLEFDIVQYGVTNVKGWPTHLAHGGVTNNASYVSDKYKELDCSIDALFKYAGINGGGDRGIVLDPDYLPTHDTIKQCIDLKSFQIKKVMPVMVIYTCELSGGISNYDLEDYNLELHYMNLLSECCVAQSYKNNINKNPATFIINPDFLGMIQQNRAYNNTIQNWLKTGSINVNKTLSNALLNHHYNNTLENKYNYIKPNVSDIPIFANDIFGYIKSINWILKTYAPDIAFGWQINIWQTGSAYWVYDSDDKSVEIGNKVISFIKEIQVYNEYKPDFIVFDKYERDEFGQDAIASYAWNATNWLRYLKFTKTVSIGLGIPSMLWQIPGSHAPTIDDGNSIIKSQHAGSGGMFFLGDDRIGKDINKIHPELLGISVANFPAPYQAQNIRDIFLNDNGYDWSNSRIADVIESNVFAILWGGGSTTSVVSINQGSDYWLLNKIKSLNNK